MHKIKYLPLAHYCETLWKCLHKVLQKLENIKVTPQVTGIYQWSNSWMLVKIHGSTVHTVNTCWMQTHSLNICVGIWRGLWQICLGLQYNQQQEDKTKNLVWHVFTIPDLVSVDQLCLQAWTHSCIWPVPVYVVCFELDPEFLLKSRFSLVKFLMTRAVTYISFANHWSSPIKPN